MPPRAERAAQKQPATRSERTRERLIDAAGAVFAARGYRGATLREIALRAGVNLAAAHYHFGSKQELYVEVARAHFEALEARIEARGGGAAEALGRAASRDALVEQLRNRLRAMLEPLLDPDDLHATLMLRELTDPSEALPILVRRWIDPMRRDTARILARLAPALDADAIERCVRSVVGQLFFHRTHRAALLLMMGRRDFPAGFADELADHVVAFTLGGLAALEARGAAKRRPARRRR
jgi:AcrR family transcriptional regulator